MRAAVLREFGDPEVLRVEEVATPEPRRGEVLLRVLALGTNRLEHYLREGSVTRDLPLPHVLGSDAVASVAAVGPDVTGVDEGQRVIPLPRYPLRADDTFRPLSAAPSSAIGGTAGWGAYAEYLVVPARWVVPDTTGLDAAQAATLPMVLVTAVRAVRTVGQVEAGQHVLVRAGASGTGSMSIQVANALGATVAATFDGDGKTETARAAGADVVVDVRSQDTVAEVLSWTDGRGADVVIDNFGGDVLATSVAATRPLGTVVTMGFVAGLEVSFHMRDFLFAQKGLLGSLMGDAEDLAWGLQHVTSGRIRPVLDRVLPLDGAAEAHRLMATNATRGTVVLVP